MSVSRDLSKLRGFKGRIKAVEEALSRKRSRAGELRSRIEALRRRYDSLSVMIHEARDRIRSLSAELSRIARELERLRGLMGAAVRWGRMDLYERYRAEYYRLAARYDDVARRLSHQESRELMLIDERERVRSARVVAEAELEELQRDIAAEERELEELKKKKPKLARLKYAFYAVVEGTRRPYERRFQALYDLDVILDPRSGICYETPLTEREKEECWRDFTNRWGWIQGEGGWLWSHGELQESGAVPLRDLEEEERPVDFAAEAAAGFAPVEVARPAGAVMEFFQLLEEGEATYDSRGKYENELVVAAERFPEELKEHLELDP